MVIDRHGSPPHTWLADRPSLGGDPVVPRPARVPAWARHPRAKEIARHYMTGPYDGWESTDGGLRELLVRLISDATQAAVEREIAAGR